MQVTKFWQILQTAWRADGANTTILGKASESAQVVSKKIKKEVFGNVPNTSVYEEIRVKTSVLMLPIWPSRVR